MKKACYFFILSMLVLSQSLWAQDDKIRVVVLDPTVSGKNFDEGTVMIVREMVSSAIVNTGKYNIIERSLIDKIIQEQKFARSGMVDDNQVIELGKMAGADKVFLSVLSSAADKGMLSLKLVDVKTAKVERQAAKLVNASEVLNIITDLTLQTLGELSAPQKSSNKSFLGGLIPSKQQQSKSQEIQANTPPPQNATSAESKSIEIVYSGGFNKKNPLAKIFVDDVAVGNGSLNEGFSISFTDNRPGRHQIRVEWSSSIGVKTYDINTTFRNRFEFEYKKTGFGYEFSLKD